MSTIHTDTIGAAVRYNAKYGPILGWYPYLPKEAYLDYPELSLDPVLGSDEAKKLFAMAVYDFQKDVPWFGPDDVDGKLGKQTWKALDAKYVDVDEGDYYIHNGVRRTAITPFNVITWKEKGGLSLHEDGGFRTVKNRKPRMIVIHWGGLNAKHCRNCLAAEDYSSHFGIDPTGVYQWLDTYYAAFHAGYVNNFSIGIDICQHPVASKKNLERYSRLSDVRVIDNPTGRGYKRVLSLDSRTAVFTRELVLDLLRAYDIPLEVPRDRDGRVWHGVMDSYGVKKGAFEGVCGHHHVSKTKWDMAVWWSRIFDGTPLGD